MLENTNKHFGAPDRAALSSLKTIRMLGLGGCNIEHVGRILEPYIQAQHYWRFNVVCEMSAIPAVDYYTFGHEDAERQVSKYLRKTHLKKILNGQYDAVIMECASDYVMLYRKIGETIIPDVRSEIFAPGWGEISYSQCTELDNSAIINADSEEYWSIWKIAFDNLYHTALRPKIDEGKTVIFLRRYLCEIYVENGERRFSPYVLTKDRNINLRRIYEFLDQYEGMIFIDPPEELYFTSDSAPFGKWDFHPDIEYYTYLGSSLIELTQRGQEASSSFERRRAIEGACARNSVLARLEEERIALKIKEQDLEERKKELSLESETINSKIYEIHQKYYDISQLFEESFHRINEISNEISLNNLNSEVRSKKNISIISDLRNRIDSLEEALSLSSLRMIEINAAILEMEHKQKNGRSLPLRYMRTLFGLRAREK